MKDFNCFINEKLNNNEIIYLKKMYNFNILNILYYDCLFKYNTYINDLLYKKNKIEIDYIILNKIKYNFNKGDNNDSRS